MRTLLPLLALPLLTTSCIKGEEADLVVHNAVIHAVDENGTTYQAMAVKDGRIIELGPERQILNKYRAKETYDAEGRPVYPGFHDGHCHFLSYGLSLQRVDLAGAKSWDEVLERTVAYANAHPEQTWVLGRGWDQNLWPVKEFPDNSKLNELLPDRPVMLRRVDGHAAVVNQKAMDLAGLDPGTPIEGGLVVVRDGKPTGVLVDRAMGPVGRVAERPDEATMRQALLDAQKNCFAAGLTMVSDAGLGVDEIELIGRMQREGALKMRVYAMVSDSPKNLEHFAAKGPVQEDRLVVRSVKAYADGALGSRGALLKGHYHDAPGAHGLQLASRDHYLEVARWCHANGFQMNTHCIGDSANRLLLDVYAEVLGGTNDLRWRIEHAQVVSPEDRPKFAAFGVVPSVQPTHATSDGPWAGDRLGPDRVRHAYAFEDLRRTMGLVALGTDFPVEDIDPLQTFRSAVLRQSATGWPEGGYQMENAMGRMDALRGMTIWNAVATFTEKDLGSLETGKFADFVVLDRDLLTVDAEGLRKMKVLGTWVHGERTH